MRRFLLIATLLVFLVGMLLPVISIKPASAASNPPGCYVAQVETSEACPSDASSAVDQNKVAVQPKVYCYSVYHNEGDSAGSSTSSYSYENVECGDLTTPNPYPYSDGKVLTGDTKGDTFTYDSENNTLLICRTTGGDCSSDNNQVGFSENGPDSNTFSDSSPNTIATITVSTSDCSQGTYSEKGYQDATISINSDALVKLFQAQGHGPTCKLTGAQTLYCDDGSQPDTYGNCADGSTATTTPPGGPSAPTCQSTGGPLSWLFCAAVTEIANIETTIEGVVNSMLQFPPIIYGTGNTDKTHLYTIWSNFRTYGDIVLVLALLAAVIAEAVGGGAIEAYTVKKMLPRILVAAILINLSIYIVGGLVDITNIIARGIDQLISQPFIGSGDWKISITGFSGGLGFAGLVGGGLALWQAGIQGVAFLALFVGLPLLLAIIGVIATLMLREGILVFLIIVSPIAFALYALPNTEQYFKKWWGLLIKTLMVYPIVAIVFAMSNVAAVVMGTLNISPAPLAQLMAVAARVAPLFLIPFAFKMSGGVISTISEGAKNLGHKAAEGIKGNVNNPLSLRNNIKRGLSNRFTNKGNTAQSYLRRGSKEGEHQFKTRTGRRLATAALWASPDFDKYRKNQNELFDKEISGKVAMGADNLERAFFARQWTGEDKTLSNGQTLKRGRWYSTYRNSEGRFDEHAAGDVVRSRRSYGGDESKVQALIKYETGKVNNDQDFYGVDAQGNTIYNPENVGSIDRERMPLGSFLGNLPEVMKDSGLNYTGALGASTGSFFATQQQRRELKHTKLKQDANGNWGWKRDDDAFVQDFAENIGSYMANTGKTSQIYSLDSIIGKLKGKEGQGTPLTDVEQRSKSDLKNIAEILKPLNSVMNNPNATDQQRAAAAQQIGFTMPQEGDGGPISPGSQGAARVSAAISQLIASTQGWD